MDPDLFAELLATPPLQPATAYWRAVELDALARRLPAGGRWLDLGCGDGLVLRLLLEKSRAEPDAVVGIDLDPAETALAEATGLYARVHTGPAAAVPEPDASFDTIVSNCVLEHIPTLEPVLDEAARLLRPGGVFLLTVPSERFRDLLGGPFWPWIRREAYLDRLDRRLAHEHYLSPATWTAALGLRGLTVEHVEGYLPRRALRRWESLSRCTAGVLYTLLGEKRRPIEIQREAGLRTRRRGRLLPLPLARALGRVLACGARDAEEVGASEAGGLLLEARRR